MVYSYIKKGNHGGRRPAPFRFDGYTIAERNWLISSFEEHLKLFLERSTATSLRLFVREVLSSEELDRRGLWDSISPQCNGFSDQLRQLCFEIVMRPELNQAVFLDSTVHNAVFLVIQKGLAPDWAPPSPNEILRSRRGKTYDEVADRVIAMFAVLRGRGPGERPPLTKRFVVDCWKQSCV